MSTPEKYFLSQIKSHKCQLPPSDDLEYIKQVNKLKNAFLISDRNLKSYLRAKSLSAIYYEKKRQIRMTRVLLIHPYSEFCRGWQLWMCFVLISSLIIFPFTSAFHGPFFAKSLLLENRSFSNFYFFLILLLFFRFFCILDIAVIFLTGYVNPDTDEMVIQPSRIARRYLSTYFFIDIISSFPIEAFIIFAVGIDKYSSLNVYVYAFFAVLPLLKLARLRTLYTYFHNIYGYFSSSYSVYKMVAALFLYFMIVHWCACLCNLLPYIIYYDNLFYCDYPPCNTSWLKLKKILNRSLYARYVAGVHRTLSCFTFVGYEIFHLENLEDKIVSMLVGFVGKIYNLFLLVVFMQMLATRQSGRTRYLEMMDQVNQYMKSKRFPPRLKTKISNYYMFLFQKQYLGEKGMIQLLSKNLQREMVLKIHHDLIEKIYLFSGLSESLVYNIISCLKPEIYLTHDKVYKVGDVGHSMYFIGFGTVAVYNSMDKEVCHLEDGEYFGELSLLFSLKRQSTIVALEPTQLFRMSLRDFREKIKPQSLIFLSMEKIAHERYKMLQDGDLQGKYLKSTAPKDKKQDQNEKEYNKDTDMDDEDDDDDDDYDMDDYYFENHNFYDRIFNQRLKHK